MAQILYSDDSIVVCIKPSGVSSENELPRMLSIDIQSEIYPIHRLDVPVGGVMIYAKTKQAASEYSKKIAEGTDFEKTYLAVCEGSFEQNEGVMEDILFKDSRKNKSFVVKSERKGAKRAMLRYRILKTCVYREKTISLTEITLITGRSHQIRVQFASRKHPLLGDGKYGSKINCPIALFSHRIKTDGRVFEHPAPDTFPWNMF